MKSQSKSLIQFSWSFEFHIDSLWAHCVHCQSIFNDRNSCMRQIEFWGCVCKYSWSIGLQIVIWTRMVCTVCFLAWRSLNFERVQIFFSNWIAHYFLRHAWGALYVLFRDGKFLHEAVGILRLCKCSTSIGLQIVNLDTHGRLNFEAVWILSTWGSLNFERVQIFYINWIADCFRGHAWGALSALFRDGKFLLEADGIFRLCKYSQAFQYISVCPPS